MNAYDAASGAGQDDKARDATQALLAADADAAEIGCPLHFAMRQVAQAAVTQHVFYAQGEYIARPDLIRALSAWAHVHEFIQAHICAVSRTTPMTQRQRDAELDVAFASLPADLPAALQVRMRQMVEKCAVCSRADACPLDHDPEPLPLH